MWVGLSQLQLALYALCQFFVLTTDGPLLGLVAAELFGQGGAAAAAATAVDDDDEQRASTPPSPPPEADSPATAAAAATMETLGNRTVGLADADRPRQDDAGCPAEARETRTQKHGGGQNETAEKGGDHETNGLGDTCGSRNSSGGSGGDPKKGGDDPGEAGGGDGPNKARSEDGNSGSGTNASGEGTGSEKAGNGVENYGVDEDEETTPAPAPAPAPPPLPQAEAVEVDDEMRSHRPDDNRYQRALLSCVAWRRQLGGGAGAGGAQVRLGAIAVLRSAVKNPSAAAEIVLGGAAAASITERPGPVASSDGGSEAYSASRGASAAATQKPSAVAMLDELTRGPSPYPGPGEVAGGSGGDGGGGDGGRQEMLSAASHGADGDGTPSVLDFMLPDAHGQGRPKALSTTALGGGSVAAGRAAGTPSVLDFKLPGRTSPPPAAPALPRRKSYHIAGVKENAKAGPGSGPGPGLPPPPQNDGIGPRPSKYLPRLERLWNGGALLFSERSDSSSGGGGGTGGDGRGSMSGGGASGGGAGPAGGRQRSESFEQVCVCSIR